MTTLLLPLPTFLPPTDAALVLLARAFRKADKHGKTLLLLAAWFLHGWDMTSYHPTAAKSLLPVVA